MPFITLNGEQKEVPEKSNVLSIIKLYNLKPEMCAVELNGKIINKKNYGQEIIQNKDVMEIIRYVGGGTAEKTLIERFNSIDLYPVTPSLKEYNITAEQLITEIINAKIKIIQYRDKIISKNEYKKTAQLLRTYASRHNILLILNDYPDIAVEIDADGVHLGQDDMNIPEARKILPNKIIGKSTHNLDEALAAQNEGADYINIGPIFSTKTKPGMSPVGIQTIKHIAPNISIPFTVMGGINSKNIAQVFAAGAAKIGVISAIFAETNIQDAVSQLRSIIQNAGTK
jgi:thiamine-phosphate pyrophosphorylase